MPTKFKVKKKTHKVVIPDWLKSAIDEAGLSERIVQQLKNLLLKYNIDLSKKKVITSEFWFEEELSDGVDKAIDLLYSVLSELFGIRYKFSIENGVIDIVIYNNGLILVDVSDEYESYRDITILK